MGLFSKQGVPKIVLRALAPLLGPDEAVRQCLILMSTAGAEPDARARPWVLAATDRRLFLFPSRQTKSGALPEGTPLAHVRLAVSGDGGRVEIALHGGQSQSFDVPPPWRGKLAELAASIPAG